MKNIKYLKTLNNALLVLFITSATAANPALGAVPELINFQGKLTNSAGNPVTAVVPMVFRLYTAPTTGTPVWTESQDVTPDAYGIYSVLLGSAAPFSNFSISFSTAYWLGVSVGTDGEMLPRYKLVSSAYSLYSLNSATAAWAGGADWPTITNKPNLTIQGNVFNDINQLVRLDGSQRLPAVDGSLLTGIATAFLADGSVTTVKLANNAVTDAKVSLSTAAISLGKFDDGRVAISTQAVSGGIYNTAGRLVQLGADGFLPVLNGANLTSLTKAQVGLDSADNTSDAAKPVSTLQQTALNLKANLAGAVFTGAVSATNLSGSNSGDETAVTIKSALGAATTLADGYLTSVDWAVFNGKLASNGNGSSLTGLTKAQVGLGNVTNTSDANKPVSTAQQTALDLKADLTGAAFSGAISAANLSGTNTGDENAASIKTKLGAATSLADGYLTSADWAVFTGKLAINGNGSALTGLTKTQVGLGNVTNTSDAAKPVSTAQQTALDLKADLTGAAFSGAIFATNLSGTNTGDENAASIKTKLGAATSLADGYLTSVDWAAFNGKLAANGNGSGLTGLTKTQVGLGNVTNTSDAAKPVSTAQQTALDQKADLTGATFSGVISATNLSGTNTGDETGASIKTKLGAATSLADGYLTSVDWAAFNGKLAANGNGSGLTGLTKAQVGLDSADNTSDAAKPVSTLQQTALNLKANLASPAFTGTVTGITSTMVGLGSVNNTSDAAKPVSTAQQTALDLKANLTGATFTGAISASNLSGTNTGDQTSVSGNAGTVTNGVYTTGSYNNPAWITGLATGKIDLSTVTAAITPMQLALSTAVYTVGNQTIGGVKTFSSPIAGDISGNAATVTTNANLTGVVTSVGNATSIIAGAISNAMLANGAVANLSGTNTGDQTTITGNAGTVTNGVYTTGSYNNPAWITALATGKIDLSTVTAAITPMQLALSTAVYTVGNQTIGGIKTFSSPIAGDISGNAATVTTNANLTGVVTSVGNATSIGAGAIGNAMLANGAVANLSGTNTGDQTTITGNAGTVTNGVYTTGSYNNPAWITALATGKIDLSTVTAAITPMQLALSTAVYTVGNQTIGGVKTFSSPIAGDISGNAATAASAVSAGKATNIAGGLIGQLPYQAGADSTGLLAAGTPGQVLQSNGGAAPSWVTPAGSGDVVKAGTQTLTGLNTFTSTITAKGFANASQAVVLDSTIVATFAADGSGVVLMNQSVGDHPIETITGCSSGAVGQGQIVTFVEAAFTTSGYLQFWDTDIGAVNNDRMLLNGSSAHWTLAATGASVGSTITLLCTTINSFKAWVEVGRSKAN